MDADHRTVVFSEIWDRLCKRFNRPVDNDEADSYLRFLEAADLTTDEIVAGGESCWATREFFPRPADFLGAQMAAGWVAVQRWAREWRPQIDRDDAMELWSRVSPRARRALEAIGGVDTLRENKGGALFARAAFFDAFERTVLEDAQARVALARAPAAAAVTDGGGEVLLGAGPVVVERQRVGVMERVRIVLP